MVHTVSMEEAVQQQQEAETLPIATSIVPKVTKAAFAAVGQDSPCKYPTTKCLPIAIELLQVFDFYRPHALSTQEASRDDRDRNRCARA